MSPMDGIEVARSIRETSDIPIILYTGHGSEDVAVEAFAVGIDDYVRKEAHPLHYEVLANRIRGLVERRWAKRLYGDILEGSRDGVLLLEETKFIYANQAMADQLGVSDPRELIGRDSLDWIHEGDRERVKRYTLGRQRGEDAPSVHVYNVETSDGRERVFETSASLINFRGRMVSLAFTRDVTEHMRMDDELRSSEQRWRSLVELAPDGIVTVDLLGRVTSINTAFTKLTGFNKDEVVGKHFTKVGPIVIKDMGRYVKFFASILRGRALPVLDNDFRRKDGSLGKGEALAQVVELEEGKKEVLDNLRDVSDRARMEEEIRESEKRYRRLVNQSPDAILTYDFKGFVRSINPALTQLTGFTEDEIVGKHFSKLGFFRARDLPKFFDVVKQIVRGEMPSSIEFKFVTKTGEPRWALARGWYLEDDARARGSSLRRSAWSTPGSWWTRRGWRRGGWLRWWATICGAPCSRSRTRRISSARTRRAPRKPSWSSRSPWTGPR